jgi:hypothetical protein
MNSNVVVYAEFLMFLAAVGFAIKVYADIRHE